MTITKNTPSEPTGTKLTEEIYDAANKIWIEEGGDFRVIIKRFGVTDFNRYEHYYGYNIPLD